METGFLFDFVSRLFFWSFSIFRQSLGVTSTRNDTHKTNGRVWLPALRRPPDYSLDTRIVHLPAPPEPG